MWFTVFFVAFILYIFQYFYHCIRGFFLTRNIPGPPSIPICGSAHYFFNKTPAGKIQICPTFSICIEWKINFLIFFYRNLRNPYGLAKSIWKFFQSLVWTWFKIIRSRSKRHRGERFNLKKNLLKIWLFRHYEEEMFEWPLHLWCFYQEMLKCST